MEFLSQFVAKCGERKRQKMVSWIHECQHHMFSEGWNREDGKKLSAALRHFSSTTPDVASTCGETCVREFERWREQHLDCTVASA